MNNRFFIINVICFSLLVNLIFIANTIAAKIIASDFYSITAFGGKFKLQRQLVALSNNNYKLTITHKSALIKLREQSIFNLQDNNISSISYNYYESVLGIKKTRSIVFDSAKNQAISNYKKKDYVFNTGNYRVFDPLNYIYQIELDLKNSKQQLIYPTVKRNKLETVTFTIKSTATEAILNEAKITTIIIQRAYKDRIVSAYIDAENFTLLKIIDPKHRKKAFTYSGFELLE